MFFDIEWKVVSMCVLNSLDEPEARTYNMLLYNILFICLVAGSIAFPGKYNARKIEFGNGTAACHSSMDPPPSPRVWKYTMLIAYSEK